ncbi:MAG: hypothetical protein GX442_19850 [Candidatus Riflebacteria bacterium]|nr:hypothetical protein [Candidatus Riflebacteria bacterium]
MRNLLLCLVLTALTAPAALAGVSLPYGTGAGQVSFYNANNHPDAEEPVPLGPLSFRVAGGDFWIADSVAGRIFHVDGQGKVLATLAVPKSGPVILIEDIALIRDAAGKVQGVWALNGGAQEVVRLALDGTVVKKFGTRGDEPGTFVQMHRLEVGPDGRLFIADKGRQKILVFSPEGAFEREVPWQWSGLCLDAAGNLCRLVWDDAAKVNHLVVETPEGKPVKDVVLDLGTHFDPELWFLNDQGEACLTFTPATGFEGTFTFAVCGADGKPVKRAELKPPIAMNRYLDKAETGLFLGVADYNDPPKGEFKIEAWSPK